MDVCLCSRGNVSNNKLPFNGIILTLLSLSQLYNLRPGTGHRPTGQRGHRSQESKEKAFQKGVNGQAYWTLPRAQRGDRKRPFILDTQSSEVTLS